MNRGDMNTSKKVMSQKDVFSLALPSEGSRRQHVTELCASGMFSLNGWNNFSSVLEYLGFFWQCTNSSHCRKVAGLTLAIRGLYKDSPIYMSALGIFVLCVQVWKYSGNVNNFLNQPPDIYWPCTDISKPLQKPADLHQQGNRLVPRGRKSITIYSKFTLVLGGGNVQLFGLWRKICACPI